MKNKWFFRLFFVLVAAIICGIVGWLIGANIGENYFVDFTFNGVRGYEATGQVGFLLGFIGSVILCSFVLFKPFRKIGARYSQENQPNSN
jgi:hypothetical protein